MPPDSCSSKQRNPGIHFSIVNFVIITIILIFVSVTKCDEVDSSKSSTNQPEKSLFDSLPLNGAIDFDLPTEKFETAQKLPTSTLQPEPDFETPPFRSQNFFKNNSSDSKSGSKSSSLFDLLPDQGALNPSLSTAPVKSEIRRNQTPKNVKLNSNSNSNSVSNSNSRTQRHSNSDSDLFSILQPPPSTDSRSENRNFEIIKQKPTSEFSFSVFDSPDSLLSSINNPKDRLSYGLPRVEYGVPSLQSSSIHRNIPILQSFQKQTASGGYSSNKGSSTLGPAIPVFIRRPSAPTGGRYYNDKVASAIRVPATDSQNQNQNHGYNNYKKPSTLTASNGAAASSGGSTVIIYAQPQPPSSSSSLSNEHGPPAPPVQTLYGVPSKAATTTTASPVPKNEIHYHYHIDNNNNNEKKRREPDVIYGTPSVEKGPPRSSYGAPQRPTKVAQANQNQQNQGGYGYRIQNNNNYSPKDGNEKVKANQDSYRALLALTDDDDSNDKENGGNQNQEDFRSRTLLAYSQYGGQQNSGYSNSNNNNYNSPSTSYGPPAQYNNPPSGGYGPPAESTTGPPPPREVNDEPALQTQTQNAQTSITLETIPITTTETRLVTVPKITQTIGTLQNIPTLSDTPFQPPPNGPSGAYGVPYSRSAHSFANTNSNGNANGNGPPAPPNTRDILNEQLLQLNPSSSDLSDIETLALLQSQNQNFQNQRRNPLLSALLLDQASHSNNQFGGSDLFLNSQSSVALPGRSSLFLNGNGRGNFGLQSAFGLGLRNGGGINLNNVPILTGGSTVSGGGSYNGGGGGSGSLRGGGTILTGDAVGAISDLIREQRLQLAVSDLRNRLRHQNRDADRNRQSYRSLFYKGALLLAGLSLVPSVASVASPLAAGAAFNLGSSLLPLTTGRRKRSAHISSNLNSPMGSSDSRFNGFPTQPQIQDRYIEHHSKAKKTVNQLSGYAKVKRKGVFIQDKIQADLEKYLPPSQVLFSSQCIQKYFCAALLKIEKLPNPSSFLLLLAALASDIDTNPWLEDALIAARNKSCASFHCQISQN